MTLLLKKIESLDSKVKALARKWNDIREENARLLQEKDRLKTENDGLRKQLEEVTGKRAEGNKVEALSPEVKQAINECMDDLEEGLKLLRQYKNGI
ncbi:MAG: hypothetical protein R3275_01285 [Saprospiraceae bacterium]|nr:hypothetical protein [Saprospiraceae bacterium]